MVYNALILSYFMQCFELWDSTITVECEVYYYFKFMQPELSITLYIESIHLKSFKKYSILETKDVAEVNPRLLMNKTSNRLLPQ